MGGPMPGTGPGGAASRFRNSVGTDAPARLRLSSSVNRSIYLERFMTIRNNMFESGKCLMGITGADWTVMCESGRRRYEEGLTLAEGQHGKTSHREGLLELTWNYGTEKDESFKYHNGNDQPQGFDHILSEEKMYMSV
ncbi:hypothetical protein ACQRIU_005342 [Beauveria bassiana]